MKKRKLNSKNPKYQPKAGVVKEDVTHKLECIVKNVKVYSTFTK